MSLIRQLGLEEGVKLFQIRNSWTSIFSEPLTLHMWPVKLSEGELLIQVDSPLWMQQLTFLKRDIVTKLSRYGVRDIRFRLGKIYREDFGKPEEKPARHLSPDDRSFLDGLASEISDEDIRTAVKKAAEKSLKKPRKLR